MDVDEQLLSQFSSLGTTDRDVLVAEFQQYVAGAADTQTSNFFLEMNDWNLHEAVGAFFDFQSKGSAPPPCMGLVCDITVGDGEAVPPSTQFNKTWRVSNNGQAPWPAGCALRFSRGWQLGPVERVRVPALSSSEQCDITVCMRAPDSAGSYCGEWRMCTDDGIYFGETIWVIVAVEEGGLLDLTQQLSSMTTGQSQEPTTYSSVTVVPTSHPDEFSSPFS